MARARFSDPEARWARDVDVILAHARHEERVSGYALAALDEARALLAETEPPAKDSAHGWIPLRWLSEVQLFESKGPGLGAAVASNAHASLAEALAAFVEG